MRPITNAYHAEAAQRKARDTARALVDAYREECGPDAPLEPLARAVERERRAEGWHLIGAVTRQRIEGRGAMTDPDTSRAFVAGAIRRIAENERAVADDRATWEHDPFSGIVP